MHHSEGEVCTTLCGAVTHHLVTIDRILYALNQISIGPKGQKILPFEDRVEGESATNEEDWSLIIITDFRASFTRLSSDSIQVQLVFSSLL